MNSIPNERKLFARSRGRGSLVLPVCISLLLPLHFLVAAPIPGPQWDARTPDGKALTKLKDDDADTASIVKGGALEPLSLLIDLKEPRLVYRVFLTGGKSVRKSAEAEAVQTRATDNLLGEALGEEEDDGPAPYPKALAISVTERPGGGPRTAEVAIPEGLGTQVVFTVDVRFRPVKGRYVRLLLGEEGDGLSWRIAELEVYGFDAGRDRKTDAVVLPERPTPQMKIGAEDLSYYLSELAGTPVPIIEPAQQSEYAGNLYCFELLAAGRNYHERLEKVRRGELPEASVNVIREGNRIIFRACSNKELLQSVWEFLERQGIRWLYPDSHGDYVPAGKGVDLSILPIRCTPSSQWIFRNFGFDPSEIEGLRPSRDATLYFWRNRYDSTWANQQAPVLGRAPATRSQYIMNSGYVKAPEGVHEDYEEGFQGFNHNFHSALPGKVFNKHRPWKAMKRDPRWLELWKEKGSGLKLGQRWSWEGCFSNPGIAEFFLAKIKAIIGDDQARHEIIRIMPVDCVDGCECKTCMALNAKGLGVEALEWPARRGRFQASGSFYPMIVDLATKLKAGLPNISVCVLPYGFIQACPKNIDRFPDNVIAWLCLGQRSGRNLPIDSPVNDSLRELVEEWAAKIAPGNLQHYDYVLLGSKEERAPVPMVSAIVERAKFYRKHGLHEGGTEGSASNIIYNPWNFYVYPRIYWNLEQSADEVLREFFDGHFRESAEPMLEYYRCVEGHQHRNGISSGYGRPSAQIPGAFSYPVLQEMEGHLDDAQGRAKSWVVKERLKRMREGFDSILETMKIGEKQLSSPESFPSVRRDVVRKLKGEQLRPVWGYGSPQKGRGTYRFPAHGCAIVHLHFASPGKYGLQVYSKSNGFNNIWPIVTCHLDHRPVHQFTTDSKSLKPHAFSMEVAEAGVHSLSFTYRNAAHGGARSLVIGSLAVGPEGLDASSDERD